MFEVCPVTIAAVPGIPIANILTVMDNVAGALKITPRHLGLLGVKS
jgi:hypothetical protein